MNDQLKAYLYLEAKVTAAFNFFISGMISALIYHKADTVPTDTMSVAIDLTITCLLTFTITAFFSRASLRRANASGILDPAVPWARRLGRLFRRPLLFGVLLGFVASAVLLALTVPALALLGVRTLPFGVYMALKTVSCALLGGVAAFTGLYAGMCRT